MDSVGIRLGAIIILGGGLFGAGILVPKHYEAKGYERGRNEVLEANKKADYQTRLERADVIIQDLKDQDAKLRKAVENYEKQMEVNQAKYNADVAAIRAAGGLRFKPTTVCTDKGSARASEAESTTRTDAAVTERLPENVEGGLFAIANECQEVQTKLTALQQWIKDHGLE